MMNFIRSDSLLSSCFQIQERNKVIFYEKLLGVMIRGEKILNILHETPSIIDTIYCFTIFYDG